VNTSPAAVTPKRKAAGVGESVADERPLRPSCALIEVRLGG
jgi:hypothetical protein